jgi:osmotically-inducible protein OsmY
MPQKETNMHKLLSTIFVLTAAVSLAGCGNTLSGAKQDAANDTAKTQQAADQASQAVKTDAQKADQAAAANAVRIPVKTAILRDPVLTAEKRNLIDVNGSDHTITLSGHVTDAKMKDRATGDAQVALTKHPGYTLSNELVVAGAGQ